MRCVIIEDFARDDRAPAPGSRWRSVTDQVMGGISQGALAPAVIGGRRCLRLTGDVRLENGGGFVQMARDLADGGAAFDASACAGVLLLVHGNGERYGVHLRTPGCVRPWQSYRAPFAAVPDWRELRIPFTQFTPHRLAEPLDLRQLRRIGLVAIGRAFHADLAVARLGFYG